jgi:hypothetical protein
MSDAMRFGGPPRVFVEADPWQSERLNAHQAAQFLQVTTGTLKNWRHRRIGPSFYRVCGAIWYSRIDLVRFVREARVECKSK